MTPTGKASVTGFGVVITPEEMKDLRHVWRCGLSDRVPELDAIRTLGELLNRLDYLKAREEARRA